MKWLARRRRAILKQWNANELTLIETVRALTDSGVGIELAWEIVSK